jgi:hypothetical protein
MYEHGDSTRERERHSSGRERNRWNTHLHDNIGCSFGSDDGWDGI